MTPTTTETPTLQTLGPTLAAALGAGWTVRPRDDGDHWARHWGQLDGPARAVLSLALRDGRLHVSGEYPRHAHGSEDYGPSRYRESGRRPRISLDPARAPAVLAREIRRRVLTIYLEELPAAYARQAADHSQKATQAETARAVAALVGTTLRERDLDEGQRGGTIRLYTPLRHVSDVDVSYGGSITVKLTDLTLHTVARVLAVVHEQAATEAEEAPA